MTYVKYTREMLSEAVAASTSMVGVLRHLGQRQNGGAHAHLRRRITMLGIDTAHFLGQAHRRHNPNPRRRTPDQILVVRPVDAKRERPTVLRRALEEIGREYRCAECGTGDEWNGHRLTLHIDHVDGQFYDCLPENLRFLCPNCHTQTATYAGRNRQTSSGAYVRVDAQGDPIADSGPPGPLSEEERKEILALASSKKITTADAARTLGCKRRHVYELQRRLAEHGSLSPLPRKPRIPESQRQAAIAAALADPTMGERQIAAALRSRRDHPINISPSSIRGILTAAGLDTAAARSAAAAELRGNPTV